MKRIAIAALAFAACAGSASAADWTGFHFGVNAGHAGDEFQYPVSADFAPVTVKGQVTLTSSGFVGGVQLGYDHQFANNWVLGVEGDLDAANVKGEVGVNGSVAGVVNGAANLSAGSEVTSLGTIRARVGYANSNGLMPYVTAGAAVGNVDSTYGISVKSAGSTLFAANGGKSSNQSGWTAGAGVEYRFSDKLSLKTEYLYTDLGSYNLLKVNLMGGTASLDADTTVHTLRVGVNYHFN